MNKKFVYLESCQNFKFQVFILNNATVAYLSATFSIKWSFIQNNIHKAFTVNCCKNFCITFVLCIADKIGRTDFVFDFCIFNVACYGNLCSRCFCAVFLFLHSRFIAFFINFKTVFFCDFFCQFERKSESIIEFKCAFTVNVFLCGNKFIQHFITPVKSFLETVFFFLDYVFDFIFVFNQVRISLSVVFDYYINEFVKERQIHA